jgi:amidophosphoribosyltransferase
LGFSWNRVYPICSGFLIKNSYVGRTFIKPTQTSRESSVNVKLNVLKEVVKGKKIVMIDDSIVRGTTCGHIVGMLKKAGAKEVHVRISSPKFLSECYFGTDVPSKKHLVATGRDESDIAKKIGADSLGYLTINRLSEMVEGLSICKGCFTGEYPIDIPDDYIEKADKKV